MKVDVNKATMDDETHDILKKIEESGEVKPKKDENAEIFKSLMSGIMSDEGIQNLLDKGFTTAPASTKYHGAHTGGLFEHSLLVMELLEDLTKRLGLRWERPESPKIIGLLHDLCKIDQYTTDSSSGFSTYVWNDQPTVKGHGIKSMIYIQQYAKLDLTDEEIACIIYHMGAFVPEKEWKDYTQAIHKYPNVLWSHTADMWASQVIEV